MLPFARTRTAPFFVVPHTFPLRRHHLPYLSDLQVGEEVFAARFAADADSSRCSAYCCRDGVLVDIKHRDRILAEAALVQEYLEPAQAVSYTHLTLPTSD